MQTRREKKGFWENERSLEVDKCKVVEGKEGKKEWKKESKFVCYCFFAISLVMSLDTNRYWIMLNNKKMMKNLINKLINELIGFFFLWVFFFSPNKLLSQQYPQTPQETCYYVIIASCYIVARGHMWTKHSLVCTMKGWMINSHPETILLRVVPIPSWLTNGG